MPLPTTNNNSQTTRSDYVRITQENPFPPHSLFSPNYILLYTYNKTFNTLTLINPDLRQSTQ
jgi:hypothetical protein